MQITLNGKTTEIPDSIDRVTGLLDHLDLKGHPVLVELNGIALLQKEFTGKPVTGGDQVEIIKMVAGG